MSQFNIFSDLNQRVEIDTRPCLPSIDSMGSLPALLRSYGKILGWSFRFIPHKEEVPSLWEQVVKHVNGKNDLTNDSFWNNNDSTVPQDTTNNVQPEKAANIPVEIKLSDGTSSLAGVIEYKPQESCWQSLDALARQAATAIADMVGELLSTRYQLWRRESELAVRSALPESSDQTQDRQVAYLLQDILRSASEGLGCVAASMYLLNENASALKMRSCWGLPSERLQDPARSLSRSAADLEAMLGRSVAMTDAKAIRQWNAPEDFPAALCVPIFSSNNILGTAWFYSKQTRRFSNRQIKMAELIAGRLGAELEREALLEHFISHESLKKELDNASLIQKNQLPVSSPWIENWDMAGKTKQNHDFGGNFYDWFTLPNGEIVCALGDCHQQGLPAALTAATVKTALRAHAAYQYDANALLEQIDRTLWVGSAADQYANLFCATVNPDSNMVKFSTAGKLRIFRVGKSQIEELSQFTPLLGQTPETEYASSSVELGENESLVVFSRKIGSFLEDLTPVLQHVQNNLDRTARYCVREMYGWIDCHTLLPNEVDYSILALKRKN